VISARQENARTLAAALDTNEQQAAALLEAVVLLTIAPGEERFGEVLCLLLQRTLTNVITTPDSLTTPSLEIIVGRAPARSCAAALSVSISGSKFSIRDGVETAPASSSTSRSEPIVELLAACYAAAASVQRATRVKLPMPLHLPIEVEVADLLGEDTALLARPVELGTLYMAGAGAIGNALLQGLSALDARGELHICDPDHVNDGNLNRCVWFSSDDVGKKKALQLALRAQQHVPRLRLVPHECVLKDVPAASAGGAWLDTLIVAVDSRRARRSLQNEIPRRVFDASTTGIMEVVLHFNRPLGDHACLSCVYYEAPDETAHEQHVAELLGVSVTDVRSNFVSTGAAEAISRRYPDLVPETLVGLAYDSLFKQLCGQGALKTAADEQVLAPFAFVSVLAGVLLAIELVRRAGNTQTELPFNYWRVSPWCAPVVRARELRPKRLTCEFCDNPILQSVVRELWGANGN
jgi:molybdopterin/thiamine biosynthesis adenylyltransferase